MSEGWDLVVEGDLYAIARWSDAASKVYAKAINDAFAEAARMAFPVGVGDNIHTRPWWDRATIPLSNCGHEACGGCGDRALHCGRRPPVATATPIPDHIDPKAAREARRREIDALLRDDAAATPAFAKARLRAVIGALEEKPLLFVAAPPVDVSESVRRVVQEWKAKWGSPSVSPAGSRLEVAEPRGPDEVQLARDILAELHLYEAQRGGGTRPRRDPHRWLPPAVGAAVEVYERSRGLS